MDRQTLRDWVHRFTEAGPDGLRSRAAPGPSPKLSTAQQAKLAALVECGPLSAADGVVLWRADVAELLALAQPRRHVLAARPPPHEAEKTAFTCIKVGTNRRQ